VEMCDLAPSVVYRFDEGSRRTLAVGRLSTVVNGTSSRPVRLGSELSHRPDQRFLDIMGHLEAQFLADALHLDIFRKDVAKDPVDVLIAAHLEEPADQLGAQSQSLVAVADDQRELGFVGVPDLAQPADPPDLVLAGLGALSIGHQRHLAVVIDEADPSQSLVSNAGREFHGMEVAKRYAALGEGAVKVDEQWLIFGANWPESDLGSILVCPGSDVLRGVRADGQSRKVRNPDIETVNDDPGIQRQEPFGRGEQGIDVDFLDPFLLNHQMAEPDHELLEGGDIDRSAATDSPQRGIDLRLLHHPPGQGRVERRQGQREILEDLDELTAGAEQEHRSELRIETAADDDLVAVELDHGLDADTLEVLGARALANRRLDPAYWGDRSPEEADILRSQKRG